MILVDSNVWIDIIQRDPVWVDWSLEQVLQARATRKVAINPIIYAELVPNYDTAAALAQFVQLSGAQLMPMSAPCAYLAGLAFMAYRKKGGLKTGVIADFFIGAHAQAEGWTLLTRDATRYRSYFPDVKLICP
jgi:predicted nucleic acid-binding protein